jgi:hypothetical protein
MRHSIDWHLKLALINSFITASSLMAAFSLALFIEFDESTVNNALKAPYYIATTCSFTFSLSAVIIAVGLTRVVASPDMSNETSQDLMHHIKAQELPMARAGYLCFFLGTESFITQFAIISLAKIEGPAKWVPFCTSATLMVLVVAFFVYCVRRTGAYSSRIARENAAYDSFVAIGS